MLDSRVFDQESAVLPPPQFSCGRIAPSPGARGTVSLGLEDVLYNAASDSEEFVQLSLAYTELVDVLAHTTEKLSLDWPDEPHEEKNKRRKLPLFHNMLHEIFRSWKQPFFSILTNVAAADFTNLICSVEQGYAAVPVIEDRLAAHLSLTFAPLVEVPPSPSIQAV